MKDDHVHKGSEVLEAIWKLQVGGTSGTDGTTEEMLQYPKVVVEGML